MQGSAATEISRSAKLKRCGMKRCGIMDQALNIFILRRAKSPATLSWVPSSKHNVQMNDVEQKIPCSGEIKICSRTWSDVNVALSGLADPRVAQNEGLAAWAQCAADFLSTTPQGIALGNWPAMPMPEISIFTFDTNRRFEWGVSLEPVSACQFHFDMN